MKKVLFIGWVVFLTACDWTPDRLSYADFEVVNGGEYSANGTVELKINADYSYADSMALEIGEEKVSLQPEQKTLFYTFPVSFPIIDTTRNVKIKFTVYGENGSIDSSSQTIIVHDLNWNFICGESWIDPRDGEEYATVRVPETGECWFAENLRYGQPIDVLEAPVSGDTIPQFYWEGNDSANSFKGALYTFREILKAGKEPSINTSSIDTLVLGGQGICPFGWHIPSDTEWLKLEDALGMPASQLNIDAGAIWRGESVNMRQRLIDAISVKSVITYYSASDTSNICSPYAFSPLGLQSYLWTYTLQSTTSNLQCAGVFRKVDFRANPARGIRRSHSGNAIYTACVRCVQD
ncbi:MAG: FISUMP domain-containing protein [Bacteroidota bacterium]